MPTDPQPQSKRVLVTGSSGYIGQVVSTALKKQGHFVRGFDWKPAENLAIDEQITANLTDQQAVNRAVASIDTVVHLAACRDDADFHSQLLEPNVIGLYHVMDAARAQGVTRVILASSVQVISGYPNEAPRPVPTEVRRPRNHYALTKIWAEDMGELYARLYGMQVLAARIGWFPINEKEARKPLEAARNRSALLEAYFSHEDARRFFIGAVEADLTDAQGGFHVLYAMGPGYHQSQSGDPAPARELIGYESRDVYPHGLPYDIPAATTAPT